MSGSTAVSTETFRGFGPSAQSFFATLAMNQNRDWFKAHRETYEREVRQPFAALVAALNEALAARSVPLSGDPKRSLMRINRDVRFSADKSPYKTYAAATLTRVPGEFSPGLLYIQVGLDGAFAGLGFYELGTSELARMRTDIVADTSRWHQVEQQLAAHGLHLEVEDPLKRLPRGFDPAHVAEVADTLRLRAFVVKRLLTDEELGRAELVQQIADVAVAGLPLLTFGWHALEGVS